MPPQRWVAALGRRRRRCRRRRGGGGSRRRAKAGGPAGWRSEGGADFSLESSYFFWKAPLVGPAIPKKKGERPFEGSGPGTEFQALDGAGSRLIPDALAPNLRYGEVLAPSPRDPVVPSQVR